MSIAEKENKSNLQRVSELLIGIFDIFSFLLIVLPLYPRHIGNYVSAVSLFGYSETTVFNCNVYWGIFTVLMMLGVIKIVMSQLKAVKGKPSDGAGSSRRGNFCDLSVTYEET